MNTFLSNKKSTLALILVFLILSAYFFIQFREKQFKKQVEILRAEQKIQLINSAKTARTAKVTPELALIVPECPNNLRTELDDSLTRLTILKPEELERVSLLLEICGSTFADQKTAAVLLFKKELEAYSNVTQLAELYNISFDWENDELVNWNDLVRLEEQLAELLRTQVILQKNIVSELQRGESSNSLAVQEIIKEAHEVSERAAVSTRQIETVYQALID